jgi:Pyruvate/2-oxoacid:ferredoxin oxidoreductase gamma subunit
MRGGNTDAAVVIGDEPLSSPPIVTRSWSAIALHHRFWEPLRAKLRDGGVVLVNSSLFDTELDTATHRVFEVPATAIATELGSTVGASMVAVAAYARLTGIVGLDALIEAMSSSLPAYRRQHLEVNSTLLRAGYESFDGVAAPAWGAAEGSP